jgi:long-chain acyl-CoA synthetase
MLNPIKYLAFRAKMEPEKLALCDFSSSLDFGRLFLFVKRIAKKLEAAGVKPGDLVVTCLPRSFDWVFTNALFHEACITCSNLDHHTIDPRLQADWVISAIPIPTLPEGQGLVVDRAWLQNALKGEPSSVVKAYASEDDLCRLILTSGSTGGAKAVPYSLKMLDERLTTISSYWSAGRNEMNLMGLSSVGGFFTALNSSFVGEPFYCPASADSVRCANQFKITSLIGSPAQLAGFAKQVETSPDGIPRVQEIRSAGGALSEALVQQLRRLFDARIYNVYGSTEVGGACCDLLKQPHHLAHAGYVLPIGDVQIVDELDQVQPFDTEGIIRVWTSSMANEYFNNPEATATSFKEGWFYPGDRGRLNENGLLFLTGRESEIINRGGVKIDPVTVDKDVLAYPGIEDAAAFGFSRKVGIEEIGIALLVKEDFDIAALQSVLVKKFGNPIRFFRVKQIPRNPMGKVLRGQLREDFSAILAEHERRASLQKH